MRESDPIACPDLLRKISVGDQVKSRQVKSIQLHGKIPVGNDANHCVGRQESVGDDTDDCIETQECKVRQETKGKSMILSRC